ncbi:MAG: HPr family phosphocarrier protein [Planctomycetaceae bacterium]|nr:HPr family phosphocarrier protein [Planctomycetaceae bacterium]
MVPVTISYDDFKNLIASRTERYFRALSYLSARNAEGALTRPLLGELLSQATQIEELLDSYGARNNCRWARFRSLTAAIKLFSNVSYELLHIQHSIPAYRLLPVKQDFARMTEQTLLFSQQILLEGAKRLLEEADKLGLTLPCNSVEAAFICEKLPAGRLPHDLAMRKIETVSKTVSLLATAFLNLAAESRQALPRERTEPKAFLCELTGPISEEKLRSLELRFHNLQSLYDTYVSTTETEVFDRDLPVLRGHISVVLHLLRTARDFAHYYERHAGPSAQQVSKGRKRLVEPERLLETLINYSINFVSQFLTCAELLCQNMLKRYTEVGQVEVPVPQYRGFHVRPSTLISKLVLHYGSDVKMKLGEEVYDASSPLELFRANEKINAHKRRSLAQDIIYLDLVRNDLNAQDLRSTIRDIIISLAEQKKIIIYEQPLKIEEKPYQPESKTLELVTDEIAKLMVTGKIDTATEIRAVFIGDKRVLDDIKLLADNGYGEDNFGNNIPLPERLVYLRQ